MEEKEINACVCAKEQSVSATELIQVELERKKGRLLSK